MASAHDATGRRSAATALVILAAVVCALAVWATVSASKGAAGGDCDNIAGACLHMRQEATILAIRLGLLLSVLVAAGAALALVRGRNPSRTLATVLLICGVVAVVTLALDPVSHLNDRWHGWLGGNP